MLHSQIPRSRTYVWYVYSGAWVQGRSSSLIKGQVEARHAIPCQKMIWKFSKTFLFASENLRRKKGFLPGNAGKLLYNWHKSPSSWKILTFSSIRPFFYPFHLLLKRLIRWSYKASPKPWRMKLVIGLTVATLVAVTYAIGEYMVFDHSGAHICQLGGILTVVYVFSRTRFRLAPPWLLLHQLGAVSRGGRQL